MLRDITLRKLINVHFVGVIAFICFNYYAFVFAFMLNIRPSYMIVALIIFHIFFFMVVWSMVHAIISDPGRVPIYWGFFAEENDNRRRRYCLLCHSFKPQRCHHCSTCQRCVLNMDHHCPWISNCVGYTNRKFFILFLFYIILTLIISIAFCLPLLIKDVIGVVKHTSSISAMTIVRLVALIMQMAFFVVISMFFKFHLELVLSNSSTLDNLEKQRNPHAGPNVYDLGSYENFVQVFGTNAWMWPWPCFMGYTPRGDGVLWRKNAKQTRQ